MQKQFFFLFILIIWSNYIFANDSTKYFIKKQFISFGAYKTKSSYRNNVMTEYPIWSRFDIINEISSKISYSLVFFNLKVKNKGISFGSEARFQLNRAFIDLTTIETRGSKSGHAANILLNTNDIYFGIGQNLFYRIPKSMIIIETGLHGDFSVLGTPTKKIKYGTKNLPDGEYDYSLTQLDNVFYQFSYIKASYKIGINYIVRFAPKHSFLIRTNVEQTFFQTPINLKLKQTLFNLSIGTNF